MIDIKLIRENPDLVKENIKKKFQDKKLPLVDEAYELDKRIRELKVEGDSLRKEKNLSQYQLADMIPISRQAVSKWESGQAYPDTEKLIQISKIFDVSLDELIGENNESDYERVTFKINESQKRLIDALIKTVDLRYELGEREIDIQITEDTNVPIDLT